MEKQGTILIGSSNKIEAVCRFQETKFVVSFRERVSEGMTMILEILLPDPSTYSDVSIAISDSSSFFLAP